MQKLVVRKGDLIDNPSLVNQENGDIRGKALLQVTEI
jgi:hypothetical protein